MPGKKKRNKLRVAFRKNRQVRSRKKDWTRDAGDDAPQIADAPSAERISGKGELTRHRTIISAESADDSAVLRDVDTAACLPGRVLTAVGLNAVVQADDGAQYECTVRRVLRTMSREGRNVAVAGDRVLFQVIGAEQGVIERVEPRTSALSRVSQGREHVIVANVDQVLIVASAAEPALKPSLVDRFLISTEKGGARAIVCINKIDLADPGSLQPIADLYARLGYAVVLTSARQSIGIDEVRSLLRDQQTVFAGQSGVGKSSLLNAVAPNLALKTAAVSDDSGKGRHTTRSARLMPLPGGGWVVDTPGIRQFELWDVAPEEVEFYFVEFRPFIPWCKFPDCTHSHEQGCAVKAAVADGRITRTRYDSYLRIMSGDPSESDPDYVHHSGRRRPDSSARPEQ